MLAGDTGLNGSFDATEVGWLAPYALDYDGPGNGGFDGPSQKTLGQNEPKGVPMIQIPAPSNPAGRGWAWTFKTTTVISSC
jgi:hypothetical protein